MRNIKTTEKSKIGVLGQYAEAEKKGHAVNVNNAASFMEDAKKEKEPVLKISMDLKLSLDEKVQRAIYWGRMDSRKEVVERALDEYFDKHPDLIQPLPPKKYGD